MWYFLLYVIFAVLASWIFALIAGLIEMGWMILVLGKKFNLEEALLKRPKRFFTAVVMKNTFFGISYSFMIIDFTFKFLNGNDISNYWLYLIVSILWSFAIVMKYAAFAVQFMFTSTLNVILMWLGFSFLIPIIVSVIVLVVSLAYYYGKVEVIDVNLSDSKEEVF